jgi:hypothetical protein
MLTRASRPLLAAAAGSLVLAAGATGFLLLHGAAVAPRPGDGPARLAPVALNRSTGDGGCRATPAHHT